jgi:peroxiredoxin
MMMNRAFRPRAGVITQWVGLFAAVIALTQSTPSFADVSGPAIGAPAPQFLGMASDGDVIDSTDYRGQIIVLEWTNHECPYTQKHYNSGAMQALQKEATEDDDVAWFSVVSSAPGEQGFVKGDQAEELTESRGAEPTAVILDPAGALGRSYGATTTPHMFIIDANGTLVYKGAIDDNPSSQGDPAKARNYVREALKQVLNGEKVTTASTQPYGCSVKYDK